MTTRKGQPILVDDLDEDHATSTSFLSKRPKLHTEEMETEPDRDHPDYYPKDYKRSNLAELPECQEYNSAKKYLEDAYDAEKTERSFPVSSVFEGVVNYDDIHKKALKMSNLSADVTLKLLARCHYDLGELKTMLDTYAMPDLVPDYVKDFVGANLFEERQIHAKKRGRGRKFYFAKELEDCVDSKTLVDFYYTEKNKVGSNWRPGEEKNKELGEEEELELEELMRNAGISIIRPKKASSSSSKSKTQVATEQEMEPEQ